MRVIPQPHTHHNHIHMTQKSHDERSAEKRMAIDAAWGMSKLMANAPQSIQRVLTVAARRRHARDHHGAGAASEAVLQHTGELGPTEWDVLAVRENEMSLEGPTVENGWWRRPHPEPP